MNNVNYATIFDNELRQKYARELLTSGLTTPNVNFVGGNTIRVPFLELSGYQNHSRDGGFSRQGVSNRDMIKTLSHDRSVEFFVDSMDVDETNKVLTATNITNTFETEHAIPEVDAYRLSKVFRDVNELGGTIDRQVLSAENVLSVYDEFMQSMDEEEVPTEGRILYITPEVNKWLMQSEDVSRISNVASTAGRINRAVRMLDEVQVVVVPRSRMMTEYDFDNGFTPSGSAMQMQMVLIHPSSVIAFNKHSYIKLWPPGSHTMGDGYLYQNRQYGDLFVLDNRVNGVAINVLR